jgi:AAA domain
MLEHMPLSQEQIDEVFASFNDEDIYHDERKAPGNGNGHAPYGLSVWNAGEDTSPPSPRGWLLGNTFCRRFLSSLFGDGGVGKTAVRYAQAIALATGRNLTDEHVFQRARVLIVSLEDDASELRRRILAARLHFNIPAPEVDGWLFLAAPGAAGGKLMTTDRHGRAVHGQLSANLEGEIIAHSIDLVMLDPFVKSHGVEENLNSAIDDVAQILSDLAAKYDVAVDVPHHISKGAGDPGNANRGRGASSLVNACRLVSTLMPMSTEEAEAFDISEEDRRLYVRIDRAKVNITRAAGAAKWFRLVGVSLGNESTAYPAGDEVQTAEPWQPPETWAGLDSLLLNRILSAIDAGLGDGNFYTDGNRTIERSAWQVVQRHAPAKSEVQCREVIRTWVKNGVLVPFDYDSPTTRKGVKGLKVDPSKRPT